MKTHSTILWAVVAACGCLDIDLLDDMVPLDSGTEYAGGGDGDADADGDTDGDGDVDGFPQAVSQGPPGNDPSDTDPPELGKVDCASEELLIADVCVAGGAVSASFRFATNEPASVSVIPFDGGVGGVLSDEWSTEHHLAVTGLDQEAETVVAVALEDASGNRGELEVGVTPRGGPAISVTEVLADPFGPEPDQELVELFNFGASEVDLSGWMVDDNGDFNGDLIPDGTVLAPGRAAIVVSPAYNPTEGQDPAPDPGALVIVLETSIGSNGLKNSDVETVELYDAAGALVSSFDGRTGPPKEGKSATRLLAELPDGDPLAFAVDPDGTSTPGRVASLAHTPSQ